ncbi:MAG: polyphosphate polymerase domain-containing protein [Melioribacteraceae bacterium]|nr:polyphosphate polymerase domain-containing protein [Melioribacteraceae bacterium]MCF8264596.1 polyphosphate polymerase domain-containing protein [Melioribacteraceae bacterium]
MKAAYRKEFKYYLPLDQVEDFKKAILPRVSIDDYARGRKGNYYTVRSIYYDSLNLKYYHEKLEGISNRKKIRIRVYNNEIPESVTFLEIKRKYENSQIKNRAKLKYENLEKLMVEHDINKYVINDFDYHEAANRFLYHINRFSLVPQTLVVYDREPFLSRFDSTTRITIDHDLRKADKPRLEDIYRDDILNPIMQDVTILEIKFYKGYSEWIQRIVEDFGLVRQAISKYTHCLDGTRIRRVNKARHRVYRNQLVY